LLKSFNNDTCEVKYLDPIAKKYLIFQNNIYNDPIISECINNIVIENNTRQIGYELSIKSLILELLVSLIRNYVDRIMTQKEYDIKTRNLERLNEVFKYIENNYQKKISIEQLSSITGISSYYFCRLFKKVTGQTPCNYVNQVRINKAELLLKTTDMNVTEIALSTGFNDINYFSRLFKKTKNKPPSFIRKSGE